MIGMLFKLMPMILAIGAATKGGDKLKAMASPVMNVVATMKAQSEIAGIVKVLRADLVADEPLPTDFAAYLERNMDSQGTDVTKDPWDSPYELVQKSGAVFVRSRGPDALSDTKDDVARTVIDASGRFREQKR